MRHRLALPCLVALLGCPGLAAAIEVDISGLQAVIADGDDSPVPSGLVVGAAAIGYTPRYKDEDRRAIAVPGFVYFGERTLYLGDRVRYYFYRGDGVGLFAYGRVRFGNLDPEDSEAWRGMDKREWQFEAGLGTSLVTDYALITARVSSDVTGTSNGQEGLLWADFPWVQGRLLLMPGFGVVWRSSNLANYYFGGVSQHEAAPGRPAHDTGSTISPMATLVTSYRINKEWLASGIVGIEHYASGTRDSPLIDRSNEITGILALGYVW
ncbi:MAG TPA: MipA/OmpV family protein [Chitinolyticbacter sp.]|nr:MipA/OmpV family protein [Chitinolyticbacter sp.]